jgi:hypothetical protein
MNIFAQNKLHTIVIMLLVLTFATFPLYIFESGGFQFVDITIVLLSLVIFFTIDKDEVRIGIYSIAPFIPFLTWGAFIEFYYAIESVFYEGFIFCIIQIMYNFYLLFIFSIIFKRVLSHKNGILIIYGCLLASCATPWLFGSGGDIGRTALSFNNPNQLAYFSIILLFILIMNNMLIHYCHMKHNYMKQNKINEILFYYLPTIIILSFANIFAFKSVSRAGIISLMILDTYLIFIFFKKHRMFASFVVVPFLFIAFCTLLYLDKDIGSLYSSNTEEINTRFSKKDTKTDLLHRTKDSLGFSNDFSILYGNGGLSGGFVKKRVLGSSAKEVHNTILAIIDTYGVVGIILFLFGAILFIIRLRNLPYKWFLIIPVLLYNMSHNGIRFRFIWLAAAFLVAVFFIKYKKENSYFKKHETVEEV